MLTAEELERLRAQEIKNKIAFKWIIIAFLAVSIIVPSAISIDFLGTPIRKIPGTVVDEVDHWSLKHGDQCLLSVATEVGVVASSYSGKCRRRWKTGDHVIEGVRIGRVTGMLLGDVERRAPVHR